MRLPATWLRGNFEPRFSPALARKDLGLALELARATDTPMRLAAICEQEMLEAVGRGWAELEASIFLTLQEERARHYHGNRVGSHRRICSSAKVKPP